MAIKRFPSLQEDLLDYTALHSHTPEEPSITKHTPSITSTHLFLAINTGKILR